MLKSSRVRRSEAILDCLRSNPYLNKAESEEINTLISSASNKNKDEGGTAIAGLHHPGLGNENEPVDRAAADDVGGQVSDETVSVYLSEHVIEIAAEVVKPFLAILGVLV